MNKINVINEEIIKNPEKYAAIYARVSSVKDNNSIKSQIEKAKEKINKENLLLYAIYVDHVSGRTTPPPDRKGFGKLIEDAKAGKFKTVVAYRHDRLVRNLKDWIDLKNLFKKLGIKILFSEETEYVSDNTTQGDFLENLLVMIAELEPNNINERVSKGRDFRRNQGVYNAAKNVPFGYERVEYVDSTNQDNIKTKYKKKTLEALFVKYMYEKYKNLINSNKSKIGYLITAFENFMEVIFQNLDTQKIYNLDSLSNEPYEKNILNEIKTEYLTGNNLDLIKNKLEAIKNHLSNHALVLSLLKNPIYSGYMLKDAKNTNKGIKCSGNNVEIDWDAFINVKNVEKIIKDDDTFQTVYCNIMASKINDDFEKDYLFKGKIYCSSCYKKLYLTDNILTCLNKCNAYIKTNLIESILEIIIDDVLKSSDDGFHKFKNVITNKISEIDKEINKKRIEKMKLIKEYVKDKNLDKDALVNLQDELNMLLQKIAEFRKQLSYVEKLQNIISNHYKSSSKIPNHDYLINQIKSNLITYITSNQDYFIPLLNKIIKSIKVRSSEKDGKYITRFKIEYSFTYKRDSDISEGID